jgi:dihydroorotase
MANTVPPIDSPERVAEARLAASNLPVSILQVAALTHGLDGRDLVDIRKCLEAGAIALGDDGRNAVSPRQLAIALAETAHLARAVFVHPEDEEMIAQANATQGPVTRSPIRPAETETRAVNLAIRALSHARSGHLHLQHLSSEGSVASLRRARHQGLAVSAEVTPHHLSMWLPMAEEPVPQSLRKVNPPLRAEADRNALIQALREGVIEAVATDHAPHRAAEKLLAYDDAAPGMVGLETALATCITIGGMGGEWLATLVERLTVGPHRILGPNSGVPEPRLRIGESATCTLFDPSAEWTVDESPLQSRSRNTPLLGATLRGTVLLTLAGGRVIYQDPARVQVNSERVTNV